MDIRIEINFVILKVAFCHQNEWITCRNFNLLLNFIADEEKRKKSTLDAFLKTPSPHKVKPKEEVKKQDSNVKRTPVSVADFFGGGSVKRTERTTVVSKRKLVNVVSSYK